MQTVRARWQWLPFDRNVIRKCNCRVFVGTRTPHLPVRYGLSPNLSSAHERFVIDDGDVRQPNSLRHDGTLAQRRQIQLCRLTAILELRVRPTRQAADSYQDGQKNPAYIAHKHTPSVILKRKEQNGSK